MTQPHIITISAPTGDSWQVISRDPIDDQSLAYLKTTVGIDLRLGADALSAIDLGCKPGTVYKVALLDDEDHEITSIEIPAL